MHTALTPLSQLFRAQRWKLCMMDDADRLIQDLGEGAYATAADLAWREDVGLLRARHHGHWSRVTVEIGRRLAIAQPACPAAISVPPARALGGTIPH